MNLLLIDVDSKIPNIALMKISGYYKAQGGNITFWRLGYSGYSSESKKKRYINAKGFDMVFVSCIFNCNKEIVQIENCKEICFGGSGYSLSVNLPNRIDSFDPDYSIYPENAYSYAFITRGCVRDCDFCVVPEKEGRKVYKYREIDQIVRHKKVRFLDNNILAFKGCNEVLKELVEKQIRCEFYQGLDIRFIDDKKAELLSQLNYIGEYTFAFDDIKMLRTVKKKIKILKRYIKRDWKIKMFLYCNTDMLIKSNIIERIEWCKKNKALPYIMRDENCYCNENKSFYTDLASYCNQPGFFKKLDFSDFIKKRKKNYQKSLDIYYQQTDPDTNVR